jgi:hypothetical protein
MIEALVQGEGLLTAICIIVMVVVGVESSIDKTVSGLTRQKVRNSAGFPD